MSSNQPKLKSVRSSILENNNEESAKLVFETPCGTARKIVNNLKITDEKNHKS